LDAQLADELVLYMAPRLLGADGRPLANLIGPQRLADSPEWRIYDLRQIGPDIRIMLRPNR
jgi:diaminohydroxyphosphoribosylaminopyrimidine deaminase/5-amino-6-(5-phosphoribosylamino)uracil reductase